MDTILMDTALQLKTRSPRAYVPETMPRKLKEPCIIPETPSSEAMMHVTFQEPDHERDDVAAYVEGQSNKGERDKPVRVIYLERIKSEVVHGTEHVAWDVHTDEPSRWWVITAPTNLYRQDLFPSLDYTSHSTWA